MAQFFQIDLLPFILRICTLVAVAFLFRNILRQGPGGKPSAWMRMLGDVSFPLYMLHIPVFELLKRTAIQSPAVYFAAAFGASVVASSAVASSAVASSAGSLSVSRSVARSTSTWASVTR